MLLINMQGGSVNAIANIGHYEFLTVNGFNHDKVYFDLSQRFSCCTVKMNMMTPILVLILANSGWSCSASPIILTWF